MRVLKSITDGIAPREFDTAKYMEAAKARAGYPYYYSGEFEVSYTPVRAGIFDIFLFGPIEDATQFIPAIQVLQAAGENDIVQIHLSSPGGSLDATDTFLDAMRNTEARVVVRASGGVHSAGTVILLAADEFYLSENFNCLIHNGSTGAGGKYSDFKAQARASEKYMDTVLRKTYAGFLTEEEIDALLEGKDFWFDAEEFVKRYEVRNELLKEKMMTAQAELMKSLGFELPTEHIEDGPGEEPVVKKPRKKKVKTETVEG
jgi:ATP-dependent protease ClpP protease subunit